VASHGEADGLAARLEHPQIVIRFDPAPDAGVLDRPKQHETVSHDRPREHDPVRGRRQQRRQLDGAGAGAVGRPHGHQVRRVVLERHVQTVLRRVERAEGGAQIAHDARARRRAVGHPEVVPARRRRGEKGLRAETREEAHLRQRLAGGRGQTLRPRGGAVADPQALTRVVRREEDHAVADRRQLRRRRAARARSQIGDERRAGRRAVGAPQLPALGRRGRREQRDVAQRREAGRRRRPRRVDVPQQRRGALSPGRRRRDDHDRERNVDQPFWQSMH
jgi:hypothetical protein